MAWDVASQAQAALASSPIQALRELRVQRDGDCLHISGRVNSFYHKQLAQEVVRLVAQELLVVNTVQVDYHASPHPPNLLPDT